MTMQRLEDLQDLAERVLANAETSQENAAIVAAALVAAEADGLPSHGLSRLPIYAAQASSGKVDGRAVPDTARTAPGSIRVDARSGFAFPAIKAGLDLAEEIVGEVGTVAVAVGRSHHSGVFGHHVERLARAGLVALGFANSPAGIAPWGGNRALYGTNPVAFACPRASREPVVVDLSLSKVARGKIKLAADRGEAIPEGWAVDRDGQATTDAEAAMAGSMLPMGDAKGAALVLAVEVLAATLTGSQYGFEASSFFTADGPPPHVGQFFIVMDPGRLAGEGFPQRVETLMDTILDQTGTRIPGQRRLETRARARRGGVEVAPALLQELERQAAG